MDRSTALKANRLLEKIEETERAIDELDSFISDNELENILTEEELKNLKQIFTNALDNYNKELAKL